MESKAIHIKSPGFGPLAYRTLDGNAFYYQYYSIMPDMGDENHHVYLISDKIANDGDVYYDSHNNLICVSNSNSDHKTYLYKKVIACTDYEFCKKYSIYPLSGEFVKKFAYHINNVGGDMVVNITTERKYIEPHASIHSNRGEFVDVILTDKFGFIKIEDNSFKKEPISDVKLEKIFDDSAKENMIEWNIESFKKTHPRLFKSIIQAIRKSSELLNF